MPLEGTQLNTAFSSGAALDTLKHSDFSPMRKDHLHFPENMPATSKKLEMVALRKHALPNENLEKVFGGCAPRPRLARSLPSLGPTLPGGPGTRRHPAGADTQKDSVAIRSTKTTISLGLQFMIT